MRFLLLLFWTCSATLAGETGLVTVYQPLEGEDGIAIYPVTCLDWNTHSGLPPAFFITKANLAPTNVPKGPTDINVASVEKFALWYSEKSGDPQHPVFTLDCQAASKRTNQVDLALLVRATLECLRLSFPREVAKAEFEFVIPEILPDLKVVADQFRQHDKTKPFFPPPGRG